LFERKGSNQSLCFLKLLCSAYIVVETLNVLTTPCHLQFPHYHRSAAWTVQSAKTWLFSNLAYSQKSKQKYGYLLSCYTNPWSGHELTSMCSLFSCVCFL